MFAATFPTRARNLAGLSPSKALLLENLNHVMMILCCVVLFGFFIYF